MTGKQRINAIVCLIMGCLLCGSVPSFAAVARIKAPSGTTFYVNDILLPTVAMGGLYRVTLPDKLPYPYLIQAKGVMGGFVTQLVEGPNAYFQIAAGVIPTRDANPVRIPVLPQLCPRLRGGESGDLLRYYDASADRLNHHPTVQLLDNDSLEGEQFKAYAEMDDNNVLQIQKVTIRYDYEDTAILDYEGPNPLTGKPQKVYEGEGGFYANFHYAVVPFDKDILLMDRQTLLHFAQGKLSQINKLSLSPPLRTHSFIPGPFLSRTGYLYELCEWGDTATQAPVQTLQYKDMAIWDWDYSLSNADHVAIIVWEGDEEDWLIESKVIDPFYLTDDVVGVFEVKREDTLIPLTLINANKDFEMTIETGNSIR